jgi:hypothetical protein
VPMMSPQRRTSGLHHKRLNKRNPREGQSELRAAFAACRRTSRPSGALLAFAPRLQLRSRTDLRHPSCDGPSRSRRVRGRCGCARESRPLPMRVRVTGDAASDLRSIKAFLSEQSVVVAEHASIRSRTSSVG